MVYLLFLALFGALSQCPFTAEMPILYWEYLIPPITVILPHRALLASELMKTHTRLWLSGWEATPCWGAKEKREARGEGLFSRAFGLPWAQSGCPSFPNEGCTQQSRPSAVAREQDHCSPGEMSCWNGQYLWHKLTWGLKVSNSIVALCHVGLKTNKGKLTLTLGTTGKPSIGCSISVWRDQG